MGSKMDSCLSGVTKDGTACAMKGNDCESVAVISTESIKLFHTSDICNRMEYQEMAEKYSDIVVQRSKKFLDNTIGAIECSSYLENYKRELIMYRSIVMNELDKEQDRSEDSLVISLICNFLRGKGPAVHAKLLPDYVLMELVHNCNYVFVNGYADIFKEKEITKISQYSVNTDKLIQVTKAEFVSCPEHFQSTVECKKTCANCRSEMYLKRISTLRVIVTMYLCPLLCDNNNLLANTITKKKTGLSDDALLSLAGYSYYKVGVNRTKGTGKRTDSGITFLNVFDPPPRTEELTRRMMLAIQEWEKSVSPKDVDELMIPSRTRIKFIRRRPIGIKEWSSWLYTNDNNKGLCSSSCAAGNDEDVSNPSCVIFDEKEDESEPLDPNSHVEESNCQQSSVHTRILRKKVSRLKDSPSVTVPKKGSDELSSQVNCVTPKRRKTKRRRRSSKVHANSGGQKITVSKPTLLRQHPASGDSEEHTDDESSCDDPDYDNSLTESNQIDGRIVTYDQLKPDHYKFNPEQVYEDSREYYKGYRHLCHLRPNTTDEPHMVYNSVDAASRFTDEAFQKHFGANNPQAKSECARTYNLESSSKEPKKSPVVGIKHKALSREIVESLIKIASEAEFIPHKAGSYLRAATSDPCSGFRVPKFPPTKEYSEWDRMVPIMRIGQREDASARLYKGIEARPEEIHLLNLVNNFVREVLGKGIDCDHNMMMMLVSDVVFSFGAHSDHSLWHGKMNSDDTYISKNGIPLPSEEDAFTFTMCVNKYANTEQLVEVTWYDSNKIDKDHPNGEPLLSVVMNEEDVHFQLPRTQTQGIVHGGSPVDNPEYQVTDDPDEFMDNLDRISNAWRIVVSYRQCVSASSCPACYLKRFDALGMSRCKLIGAGDEWFNGVTDAIEKQKMPTRCSLTKDMSCSNSNMTENEDVINDEIKIADNLEKNNLKKNAELKAKYFLNHHQNRDQYKNCSQEDVDKLSIPLQDTYICEEPCLSDVYNSYDYLAAMLKKGIVPNVGYLMEKSETNKKKRNKICKTLKGPNSTDEDAVQSIRPLPKTEQNKTKQTENQYFPPLLYKTSGENGGREYFKRDRTYLLETVLKNSRIKWDKKLDNQQELKPPMRTEDWRIFNTFICHRKYKSDKQSLMHFFKDQHCRWINVIGSGGSPSKMDKHGADWGSVLTNIQDVAHLPHSQPLNDMNSSLIQAAQNNRPVAVFIGKEVYDHIWSDPSMSDIASKIKQKTDLEKDNVYFLGYFQCIKQQSVKGIPHEDLAIMTKEELSIETQRLNRFREMSYFQLTLELIPDMMLDILPVKEDGKSNSLVHFGGALKEVTVQFDPHERARIVVDRQDLSKCLSLGNEREISAPKKKKSKKGNTDEENDDATLDNALIGDDTLPKKDQSGKRIQPLTRRHVRDHHINTELKRNGLFCRDVLTNSRKVKSRDKLPKPRFGKVFCSRYDLVEHEWVLKLKNDLADAPELLRQVLKHKGLDNLKTDPDLIDFQYNVEDDDHTNGADELDSHNKGSKEKRGDDIEDRTKDEMVGVREAILAMVFVSAAVLYRTTRAHIDKNDKLASPLKNKSVGSKSQLYPTKSPNSILDMGRFTLRNELIREKRAKNIDCHNFKVEVLHSYDDDKLMDYCFKSLILTFNGRPSVIGNYFRTCKNSCGGAIPCPDEIGHFLHHLSLNISQGTSDGGIFNQQWTVCPQLNTLAKYQDFMNEYASLHKTRFILDVIKPSMNERGEMVRKDVLDNWVKFAARCNTNGAGETLKFRFHIHQAMINVENLFVVGKLKARVFGNETLESVCLYSGSKEGWNKLRINEMVLSMKSSDNTKDCASAGNDINEDDIDDGPTKKRRKHLKFDTTTKKTSKTKSKKGGKKSRSIRLDDDNITCMADLMTVDEFEEIMSYLKDLDKQQLSVLLMYKDAKGILRNSLNDLEIGPCFIEHILCVLQYYLRRFSSGYNVSQRNEFDRPNFQPLKFNSIKLILNKDTDPRLWELVTKGIASFESFAGIGDTWKNVKDHPPLLFLIDDEIKLIKEGNNQVSEGRIIEEISKNGTTNGSKKRYKKRKNRH